MVTFSLRLPFLIFSFAVAISTATGVTPVQAQSVAAMVNGEPITNFDVDQRMRLMALSNQKANP